MINLIETEFIKQKRSKIMTLTLLSSMSIPAMYLIGVIHHKIMDATLSYTFTEIYNDILLYFFMLFGVVIFSLIISHIISQEYKDHTIKTILTSPVSRTHYILSKILMSIIWVMIITVITFLFATLIGFIVGAEGMTSTVFLNYGFNFILGGFLLALAMIPFAFITLVFKNNVAPVILGVIISLSNSIIMQSEYAPLSPWCSPILFATNDIANYTYSSQVSILIIAITFLTGLALSIIYFKLRDVDL